VNDNFYEGEVHVFYTFHKYHIVIKLGVSNAKVGKEDISNPTIGNETLHEIRQVKFFTSKVLNPEV
jgi:hypothetical protein